ncbi:type II toxin-antitoxin system RelE/ParE family toxin [Mucilaginibacter terrae]|uniref:type II toxin-antitoxin system RelE/ParE family toxin n=1 Tax=Mucilaginibacter terrae TaxID=1955052 RepID=UPI0036281731
MDYNVKSLTVFEKQVKRLLRKYPSLKANLLDLVRILKENPDYGTAIGRRCYKVRVAITSKGKGKSGGARVITNFTVTDNTVYLLSIYDKSEKENLTNKELTELLSYLPE